jgi:hypothetical protein
MEIESSLPCLQEHRSLEKILLSLQVKFLRNVDLTQFIKGTTLHTVIDTKLLLLYNDLRRDEQEFGNSP